MARRQKSLASSMVRASFDMARMAADAQFVIAARMLGMATGVAAKGENTRMVAEKQAALVEGAMKAGMAAATGKSQRQIADAAVAPAKRTLAANKKRLGGAKRKRTSK
ncbi:antifreeze protein [Pseudohoeflea suaedae]|uniref:Antifreeze protein n=1 Tax=Pseudohoeflea suaedae TaxID=877384 RepID=A0A4R5PNF4_9HYPH|nr:antifreeze protein [Pseudohoeflea suaedae]TDH38584.1 antifreeze protein [Pseudohoeflea suaedae]